MRQFLTLVLSSLLSLSTLSHASPIEDRAVTESYLQTKVINGTKDVGSKKGGLYVYAYHTGAGLNDAVLSSNKTLASKGHLNGTLWQFDLGGSLIWDTVLVGDDNYAGWEPVQIDAAAEGTPTFSVNETQLVGSTSYEFGGWLACDWWHGHPQLFYLVAGYKSYQVIPRSCSTVSLQVVTA